MVIDPVFFKDKPVLLTGHTGFKGAWCSLVLRSLGAKVHGLALPPDQPDGFFQATGVQDDIIHRIVDIRNFGALAEAVAAAKPEIVIHMAAQALVRESYSHPVQTYATNVMGTVHLLEAVRACDSVQAVVVVTTDKCYDNLEPRRFRETDRLGGHDPYSNSKACAELVADSYRRSFFHEPSSAAIATVRAGNVIGGGDWSRDRLVPDAMRAFVRDQALTIRNPAAIRPWQHVLDPVLAYIGLAQQLCLEPHGKTDAFNFGPSPESEVAVEHVANRLVGLWGGNARWTGDGRVHPHEALSLRLDCAKAEAVLGWRPIFDLGRSLELTTAWYKAQSQGQDMRKLSIGQIEEALSRQVAPAGVA